MKQAPRVPSGSLGSAPRDNICRADELKWGAQCVSQSLWSVLAVRTLWGLGIPLWVLALALALFSYSLALLLLSEDVNQGNNGSYFLEILRGLNEYILYLG